MVLQFIELDSQLFAISIFKHLQWFFQWFFQWFSNFFDISPLDDPGTLSPEVNGFTDAEGWRYARHFGKGAIWRSKWGHFTAPFGGPNRPRGQVRIFGITPLSIAEIFSPLI